MPCVYVYNKIDQISLEEVDRLEILIKASYFLVHFHRIWIGPPEALVAPSI